MLKDTIIATADSVALLDCQNKLIFILYATSDQLNITQAVSSECYLKHQCRYSQGSYLHIEYECLGDINLYLL